MQLNDILKFLKEYDGRPLNLMEVCGTHTASIFENAIESLLSEKIHLISGPGCPVCVTVSAYVDRLCALALDKNNVIVTFGDMIRVPGSKQALRDVRAQGADVRMVYTPLEMLAMAQKEKEKTFIFAAVGFETTTPVYALLLDEAVRKNIKNIKILSALKTMPNVIKKLCTQQNNIDGFLAPGHVAVLTGSNVFEQLAAQYSRPFAVSGFKAEEILASVYALVKMQGTGKCVNLYKSVVRESENEKAKKLVEKYFRPCTAAWRGIGMIENSGMILRDEYSNFDAGSENLTQDSSFQKGCCCGEIITGRKRPTQCPLYKTICTLENPMGSCMVSNEGTCFNYYMNDRG